MKYSLIKKKVFIIFSGIIKKRVLTSFVQVSFKGIKQFLSKEDLCVTTDWLKMPKCLF